MRLSLEEIEDAIQQCAPEEQRRLLAALPTLLHISSDDLAWMKLAEPSFELWNNPDDAVYDTL